MDSLRAAILAVVVLIAVPATAQYVGRSPDQADAAGRTVKSSHGERMSYSREQIASIDAPILSTFLASPLRVLAPTAAPGGVPEGPYTLGLEQVWQHSVWGTSLGRSGMVPADLDGDGALEIVLGASLRGGFWNTDAWHVVRLDPASGEYEIAWTSPLYETGAWTLAVHRIGGAQRIFVGLGGGRLLVYDGASLALIRDVAVTTRSLTAVHLADADNDGTVELVIATDESIHLLDPNTYATKSVLAYGASDIAIGNVDGDAALEIVLSSGRVIQFSAGTATVEWDFSVFAPAWDVDLADLDDDGMEEIVAAGGWYSIYVYDADLRSPKFQIAADLDIQSLLLVDVTGDGREEILYGDGQWGAIHAHPRTGGPQLWEIPNPEHGTTRIAVADTDSDGQLEVMWGAGHTSSGPDHFFVHGVPDRALEFSSPDIVGPFAALDRGDVDDDGGDETVAISWQGDSGYGDGVLHIFDSETLELEWRSGTDLFQRYAWTGVRDVAVGDVDGDGETEIVVAADRLYDRALHVIDGRTHQVEQRYTNWEDGAIQAIEIADADGDGVVDIVAVNEVISIIDGATGVEKWRSVALNAWPQSLAVADLDGGGIAEIVAAGDGLFVADGEQRTLARATTTGIVSVDLADSDGDSRLEIWGGTTTGNLLRFDSALTATTVGRVCETQVNSLKVELVGAFAGSILFACEDDVGVYGLYERRVVWRSPPLSGAVGLSGNLQVFDRGSRGRLLVGTQTGIVAFEGYGTGTPDIDADGILNHLDNCPELANPEQADADGDLMGDACNDAVDRDGDEWANAIDNCPDSLNAAQADADSDGIGDACNDAMDGDADEWADALDNCAATANADQANRDGDEVGDSCDPYPDNPDNYAARCEEAITNEAQLEEALGQCLALPRLEDVDHDGEADSTDRCKETPLQHGVDAAGCSRAQFCGLQGGGVAAVARCLAADWKNDESLTALPRDCYPAFARTWGFGLKLTCLAR